VDLSLTNLEISVLMLIYHHRKFSFEIWHLEKEATKAWIVRDTWSCLLNLNRPFYNFEIS